MKIQIYTQQYQFFVFSEFFIIMYEIQNCITLSKEFLSKICYNHTTVSWGKSSTISILRYHNFLANSGSREAGEHFEVLHSAKYLPVMWVTSSETAQYIEVCAPSWKIEISLRNTVNSELYGPLLVYF